MLYDVLPPLVLFISFGGIIALVSRVIMRMKHVQFSRELQAEAVSAKPIHENSLLRPNRKGVSVAKNRISHMVTSARQGVVAMKDRREARKREKEEQAMQPVKSVAKTLESATLPAPAAQPGIAVPNRKIQLPEFGFQDKVAMLAQKGKRGISVLQKGIANRMPDVQKLKEKMPVRVTLEDEPKPKSSPMIRLVRHSEPVTQEEEQAKDQQSVKKNGIMSHMLRRDTEKTPNEKAADAIEKKQYEQAEDILIAHIMKHSSDTDAYMMLGRAAIGKEAWEEAIEIFQQVIKLDSTIVDAYAELGHAALNAGKFTLAIQSLQHARDMDAKNIRIREELLFIARRMDNKVVEKGVLEELAELKQEA